MFLHPSYIEIDANHYVFQLIFLEDYNHYVFHAQWGAEEERL
jgi:hypothetical protein